MMVYAYAVIDGVPGTFAIDVHTLCANASVTMLLKYYGLSES